MTPSASYPEIQRHNRIGLLIVAIASATILVCLFGCGGNLIGHADQQQQALAQSAADIGTHAANAGTHTDHASAAVADAVTVAKAIPAAAPVLPPLQTAGNELDAVKAEIAAIKETVGSLTGQVSTLAGTVKTLTSQNTTLATENSKLAAQWSAAWLGGRSWFWIRTLEIIGGLLFVGLFVAEYFLSLPIHPLTWILMLAPFLARLCVNVSRGFTGAFTSATTFILGLFKSKPAAPVAAIPAPPSK